MDTITHKLGGKEREFRFDFKAIAKWCRMEGYSLQKMDTVMTDTDLLGFSNLTYWAHRSAVGSEAEFTPDDVLDWFSDDMEAFGQLYAKAQDDQLTQSGKKKRRTTKTKTTRVHPSTT